MTELFEIACLIAVLLAMLSILWSTIRTGISPMPSSSSSIDAMISLVPVEEPEFLIDLGSGWGNVAHRVATLFPKSTVIGYELSILPYLWSILFYRRDNLRFLFKSFTSQKFPDDAILFTYLYPEGMLRLSQELKDQHCWLISNCFALGNQQSVTETQLVDSMRSKIYLYRIG